MFKGYEKKLHRRGNNSFRMRVNWKLARVRLQNRLHKESLKRKGLRHQCSMTLSRLAERLLSEVSEASERLGREVTSIQQAFSDSQRDREATFLQSQQQHENHFHKSVDPQIEDIGDLTEQGAQDAPGSRWCKYC